MQKQTTSNILMIRPVRFQLNKQTAVNNYYQKVIEGLTTEQAQEQALKEFDNYVTKLRQHGINVIVIDDTETSNTPDSIFPNNWISFHADKRIGLYPMFAENRRLERRDDIIATIKNRFDVAEVLDMTGYEGEAHYLEGTGSLVLDRVNKIAYAALSVRTDSDVIDAFSKTFGYDPVKFIAYQTVGNERLPIYHTNVMMCVADDFAVLCADAIDSPVERANVVYALEKSGKEIIYISENQKSHFAGNMLQVNNSEGETFLVMSSAAFQSLNNEQIAAIEKHCPIIHSSLDTIEALGGGSARCMMAEVFLPEQS